MRIGGLTALFLAGLLAACGDGGICAVQPATVQLGHPRSGALAGNGPWQRDVALPATGRMVGESHLVTTADRQPAQQGERIQTHLERSCRIMMQRFPDLDCGRVYNADWIRQWTPAEGGGQLGQGSSGQKPAPEAELYAFNMMWRPGAAPEAGSRWLICNEAGSRCVVAAGGYETGPAEERWLGGVQRELQYFLGADNETPVTVRGPLRNQSVPFGPVDCRAR